MIFCDIQLKIDLAMDSICNSYLSQSVCSIESSSSTLFLFVSRIRTHVSPQQPKDGRVSNVLRAWRDNG